MNEWDAKETYQEAIEFVDNELAEQIKLEERRDNGSEEIPME